MAPKKRLTLIKLLKVFLVVVPFLFHLMPDRGISQIPFNASGLSTTQISQLEQTIYGNSITGSPVNVPVPTINFFSNNGGSATANFDEVSHSVHHTQPGINYFSFSGNPVFPHATDSPRLHLAFMIMRI